MTIQDKCDQLIENYNRILPGNHFEHSGLLAAGAAMYLANGLKVDPEKLRECKRMIRKQKGLFSNFRGTAEFIVRCKMAMADDPAAYLERLTSVYQGLRSFFSGEQVLLAAMVIADLSAEQEGAFIVQKTKSIYQEMRKTHPWLTLQDDMPFAALMAISGKDCSAVYEEAEKVYENLKQSLRAPNDTRQTLSHILAIYPGFADSKCEKICRINEELRKNKHAPGRERYLSILGTLAGSSLPAEELARMIGEADDYLKSFKPFRGIFGVGTNVRRMIAVQMVEAVLNDGGRSTGPIDSVAVSSVISISIEVAIITLILMYAVIASTSASSGSHS